MNEASFLAAAAANPEDDVTRLVHADWLEENGDPARADFIRCQVALACLDEADPRYPALLARSRRSGAFTRQPERPMADHVPGGRVTFRRGLISGVEISAEAWLRHGSEAWQQVPFEQVRLLRRHADPPGMARDLANRPELARVRTLCLEDWYWNVEELAGLLSGGAGLTALRALHLIDPTRPARPRASSPFTDLVQQLSLPALDSLSVDFGTHPPPYDWRRFLPAAGQPLGRVRFGGCYRADDDDWEWEFPDLDWLMRTRHGPTLTEASVRLQADGSGLQRTVAAAPLRSVLSRLPSTRLRRLTVPGAELGPLLGRGDWGDVTALDVHGGFDDGDLARLLTAPQGRRLRTLSIDPGLSEVRGTGRVFRDAVAGGCWPELRRLSMVSYPVELLCGPFSRRLLRLDVGWPTNGTPPLEAVVAADFPEVRWLTIDGVRSAQDLRPLFSATGLPNLCTLVLSGTDDLDGFTLENLARAPAMPHLSLVEVRRHSSPRWWVLGSGRAEPVVPEVIPTDEDWWEGDRLADWFW